MKLFDRLKPHLGFILILLGGSGAYLLAPLDWIEGLWLFVMGLMCGRLNEKLNPTELYTEGPELPWEEMRSGEKFAYFLPSLVLIVLGGIAFMMAIQFSRLSVEWSMIGASLALLAIGIFTAYWRWIQRFS